MGGVRSRERGGHSKHKVKSKDCGVVSSEQKFYPGKWKGRKQLTIQQVWKTRKGESTWASPSVCARGEHGGTAVEWCTGEDLASLF